MLLSHVHRVCKGVLHLSTACAVEPMLHAYCNISLLHLGIGVVIEIIHRPNDVENLAHRHTSCDVGTPAVHVAVSAAKHFAVHAGSAVLPVVNASHMALPLRSCRPAVALVVFANSNSGIVFRHGYGMSCAQLTACHDAPVLNRTVIEPQDNILLVVLVLDINALALHHSQLIV